MCMTGSGRGSSASESVSPIVTSGRPAMRDDLAGAGLVGVDPVERLGDVELGDLAPARSCRRPGTRRLLPARDRAAADPADREPAEVRRGVEVRDERLQRMPLLVGGRRDVRDAACRAAAPRSSRPRRRGVQRCPPGARVAVHDREVDLRPRPRRGRGTARRPRRRPRRCARRAVHLVDHEHHRQPRLERLAQHEARLGQRALARVHQQQHAVDHREAALDLAAEVGVARACR